MTQSQLQSKSKVSRSYLSRIESGQMTPSLGTLEKISEALNVGLNRFFSPESDGEALLEDPFIQGLRPFLQQLDWEQWQSILKRLQAISDHVNVTPANLRPIGNPSRLPQPATANGGAIGHAPSHSNGHALNHAHGHPQGYPLRRPSAPFAAQGKPAFQRPLARYRRQLIGEERLLSKGVPWHALFVLRDRRTTRARRRLLKQGLRDA